MFIIEKVPASLRGELTRWMLQLKPGVFLGTLSTLVGEKLWEKIKKKIGAGRAIWVKTTNNEQRFELATFGDTKWSISNFDGLQLITRPFKRPPKKLESEISLSRKKSKSNLKDKETEVSWDSQGTPMNLITRKATFKCINSNIQSTFTGTSAYHEYPPDILWQNPWMEDINTITHSIMSFVINNLNVLKSQNFDSKIACLDIETTDYLPKAFEGFVNIIGVAILKLNNYLAQNISIELFQVFNMTRKKQDAPLLIKEVIPYLKSVDKLLVFNKDFDIKILNTIINEFSLDIILPSTIIDLQDSFISLKDLEEYLTLKVGIKRKNTEKGKYSEYYKLFKGIGRNGNRKQIEPIGIYNLTDALTPLYAYLLREFEKYNK